MYFKDILKESCSIMFTFNQRTLKVGMPLKCNEGRNKQKNSYTFDLVKLYSWNFWMQTFCAVYFLFYVFNTVSIFSINSHTKNCTEMYWILSAVSKELLLFTFWIYKLRPRRLCNKGIANPEYKKIKILIIYYFILRTKIWYN